MREEITRFSDIVFSARPGERAFWLGSNGKPQDVEFMRKLGGPKPCVHGSDAHALKGLFKPEDDRFCWIKADPNFDGLRQILLEPADRVHIGPTPPMYHDEARVIDSVVLMDTDGWFDEEPIPLNTGLVSIIGQKGSGKSALAELTSYAAGSWEPTEGSFIGRAESYLLGMKVRLRWADGHETQVPIGGEAPNDHRVRFLSQRFVEKLCADDQLGEDLVREIEAVIFAALDPTDTLNASSFQELRDLRTETMVAEGEQLREEIGRLIRDEISCRTALAKIPDKERLRDKLKDEADGLTKQMPPPASAEEARTQASLQQSRTRLGEVQSKIGAYKQQRQRLVDIRGRVQAMARDIERYRAELQPALTSAAIPVEDQERFTPKFDDGWDRVLRRRDDELGAAITTLEGDPLNPAPGTVRQLNAEIERLSKQESVDKARQDRVRTLQTRLAAIAVEIGRLDVEIAQRSALKAELAASRDRRLASYTAYFANLAEEQKVLEALYQPVHDKLAGREHEQDLKFSIRWEVDLADWLDRGSQLMDQRRTLPYGTMTALGAAARRILVPAWTSGDSAKISEAHEAFMSEFRGELPPSAYLRAGANLGDLLGWLYDVEHIGLNYGLKYRGVDLEKLSPGTKGIVLLILYLGLDEQDTRPLIVDQPDENLDNESIFELLTTYFRSAKKRRQIVLITHNPNLVVNGDSEQVIVATAQIRDNGLPHIAYSASSLENSRVDGSGIRQRACRILEGGTEAFRRREQRYALA
jgi:energy-coupling factor transporter ATP-binding protein EcfA2